MLCAYDVRNAIRRSAFVRCGVCVLHVFKHVFIAMDLSKDEILNLIDEYKKHRVLWDTSYKGHFNKNTKIMAWEEIAETCGIDARDARRKMASLLGSFRREKAKLKITKANSENVIVIISFICLQYYVYLLNEVIYSLMFDERLR